MRPFALVRVTDLPQLPRDPVAWDFDADLPPSARTAPPPREFLQAVLAEERRARAARVLRQAGVLLFLLAFAGLGFGLSTPTRRASTSSECSPKCPSGQTCYKGACVKAAAEVAACLRTIEQVILETSGQSK